MRRRALLLLVLGAWLGAWARPAALPAAASEAPLCLYLPPLRYPEPLADKADRLRGTVLLRVQVDGRGRLAAADPLRSDLPELFVVEALRAARQGRYLPAPGQAADERRSLVLLLRFSEASAAAAAAMPSAADPTDAAASPAAAAGAPTSVPAAAPASAPAPAAALPAEKPRAPAAGGLRVLDAGFGRDVADRRLVGRAEVFGEGDRVYFWMEVEGARVGEVLRHIWIYRGREMQEIALTLKAERWATWSYKTFYPDQRGAWLLELRDESDDLLGSWSCYCE